MHIIPSRLLPFVQEESVVVRSPGRINLIGEHTDYNDGFVLPAAIDKAAYIVITPRTDQQIFLQAVDLEEQYQTTIQDIAPVTEPHWPNYLLGVVAQFINAGITVPGFTAALHSDVPVGAGLSSSAAVECAMASALNVITGAPFTKMQLAKMAQLAEHSYAGVLCGIMDQFASMMGKKDHVIQLDCRSLDYEYVPFNLKGYQVLLFDTGVKHSLASSEYNIRRQQCEQGVRMIQKHVPSVNSLRDVNIDLLDQYVLPADTLVYKRCRYVVEENARLLHACDALKAGAIELFGKKMFATHYGLSNEYEVSCRELDFLVACVENRPEVAGARMMGGGFGGCTINLVKQEAAASLIETVSAAYVNETNKTPQCYTVQTEDGATVLRMPR